MTDQPKLTPEIVEQIVAALKAGNAIVCLTKCYPCQFGQHTDAPHTWMDEQDAVHAGIVLTGHASRAKLAASHPCGCHCNAREPENTPPTSTTNRRTP